MEQVIKCYVGVIGSGKNYSSQKYASEMGSTVFDFSDGIRDYAWKFLGWRPRTPDQYREFKTSSITFNGKTILGRELLENIAESMKKFHGLNFWANYLKNNSTKFYMETGRLPVISSVRFSYEVEACIKLGELCESETRFIFTNYLSGEYDPKHDHISEKFAQYILQNFAPNNGEDITHIVKKLIEDGTVNYFS